MTGIDADSTTFGAMTAPSPTTTPSTITARDPTNAPSSTMTGRACGGSSTPPIPTPPDEVDVGPDLRARADRRPCVDHRARSDPGADVDEPRHQHDSLGEERAVAGHAGRDDAHAAICVVGLHRDLVEELQPADVHRLDLAHPEVEEDRLLQPLVDHPAVFAGLGDANVATIECRDGILDDRRLDLIRFPQLVDALREIHHGASSRIGCVRKRWSTS